MTPEVKPDPEDRAALEHQAQATRVELEDTLAALQGKVREFSEDARTGANVFWIGALGGVLLALTGLRRAPQLSERVGLLRGPRGARPKGALFGIFAALGLLAFFATRAARDGSVRH